MGWKHCKCCPQNKQKMGKSFSDALLRVHFSTVLFLHLWHVLWRVYQYVQGAHHMILRPSLKHYICWVSHGRWVAKVKDMFPTPTTNVIYVVYYKCWSRGPYFMWQWAVGEWGVKVKFEIWHVVIGAEKCKVSERVRTGTRTVDAWRHIICVYILLLYQYYHWEG